MSASWDVQAFLHELKRLLQSLDGTDITELGWEAPEIGFRVRRKRSVASYQKGVLETEEGAAKREPISVASPVVGVFHFPEERPVKGALVKEGKELGYIEAINMMHLLEIEKPGLLLDVHVEEGQPVEFGQLLFTLDSAHVS